MEDNKWDHRFLRLAKEVSSWSKDPKTQVGCVIVQDRKVVSTGYNGFPKGVSDDLYLYLNYETKSTHVIHAEHNAILNSAVSPCGATLYSTFSPCLSCALVIIQSGLSRVVTYTPPETKWSSQQYEAMNLMEATGIEVDLYDGVQYVKFS